MQDRVEYLTNEATNADVFFREYVLKRAKFDFPIFIIEGKDDPKFYCGVIGSHFGADWDFISAGGKSNVLDVRHMIKGNPEHKADNVAFLIDRDFDAYPSDIDLYITPTYSIENLYCKHNTFRKIIIGECGLSDYRIKNREEIINRLVNEYTIKQQEFHKNKRLILVNALYFFAKKEIPSKNISANEIAKIEVTINNGKTGIKIIKKRKYSDLLNHKSDIKKIIRTDPQWKIISDSPGDNFRGKQEILFFREALKQIRAGGHFHAIAAREFGMEIKLDNPSMTDHALSTSAQYVPAPQCLIDFLVALKNHFNKTRDLPLH